MNIPIPDKPDPRSNLIEFKRTPREGALKPIGQTCDSCRHVGVFVNEATRVVTCQECSAQLDAFQVLYEMALKERAWLRELDEWDARRDSMLSERYDAQWQRERAEINLPPTDRETLHIWETFRDYFKGKFVAMYRRKRGKRSGPEWYGRSSYGGTVSYEYARAQLVPKLTAPKGQVGGSQ